ncbi:E3 ubiquitin-protein ligase FANCL, partial [Myotis brandtii]
RMKHSPDLMSFMMELKMVLEVALKNKQEIHALPPPPQFYSSLIEEIGILGWDNLVYADSCFSTIKLKAEDASGREHLITLKLKAKYPVESPDCFVDFPVSFSVSWTPQDFSMDCGICYAYQLDGAIPDQVCDYSQCGQPFHQICLYEWLRGLQTSRQSFNILFGECPYCSKPITLKMSGRKP